MFSPKQAQAISALKHNSLKRINIYEGSVRSGKTYITVILWALWVATMPADATFIMVGKTLTSLKRNVLDLLEMIVGKNFTYSLSKKEGNLFGRRIYLEGVNDARSESKIRGMTLTGAYCDELTLFAKDFFAMLLSRLSMPGAKLIGTTNPDSPNHWLMQEYISRASELDMLVYKFLLDDNTFLDPEYIRNLKKEYTGVFYDRFILGKWVIAEGLVYPMFDRAKHVRSADNKEGLYYISIDYGTVNPCSMGLWKVSLQDRTANRVKEFYHDGRTKKVQKTDEEYHAALVNLAGNKVIQSVVVDPSAASFIETIRRHGIFSVKKAVNDVLDGIRITASLLNGGMITFNESCKDTIREFGLYSWDETSGEDKVIKENDHTMDDIRYFCNTILRREFKWDNWGDK